MASQILIVDDDRLLRQSLAFNLARLGYEVQTAASAEEAVARVRSAAPDLILLDIGLPGMDGLEALRLLRNQAPVIFVSARQRELDEVLGLELGAEDYITKPFDLDILVARIRVVLRRQRQDASSVAQSAPLVVGDITIDVAAHSVMVGARQISMPPREFQLLYALALDAGRVISTDSLLARVWGAEYEGEPQIVYVCIRALREKIEADPNRPQRVVTVRGVGYKLMPVES